MTPRPAKTSLATAARLLRATAKDLREFAVGHREMASVHRDASSAAALTKWARQKDVKAKALDAVADWMDRELWA